jgi:2-amino-4-hydroxy-6-hydroxymethyldihydropteridine diphosphokinase
MIFIGIGSSIGNAEEIFHTAEKLLRLLNINVIKKSKIFKNPPLGGIAKNEFSNAVWEIAIPQHMTPHKLLRILKATESDAGRDFSLPHWDDRLLDLDILIFHDEIVNASDLSIPHAGIATRNFVLKPLAELVDENFEIPTLGTLKSLLKT